MCPLRVVHREAHELYFFLGKQISVEVDSYRLTMRRPTGLKVWKEITFYQHLFRCTYISPVGSRGWTKMMMMAPKIRHIVRVREAITFTMVYYHKDSNFPHRFYILHDFYAPRFTSVHSHSHSCCLGYVIRSHSIVSLEYGNHPGKCTERS